jgi:hypothetical protein
VHQCNQPGPGSRQLKCCRDQEMPGPGILPGPKGTNLSLRDKLNHFCWTWIGTMGNRELEDSYYTARKYERVWKEARCNGLRSVLQELQIFKSLLHE